MTPIQDLLNRIRWDPKFGKARFVLGYYDRVERRIVHVPLEVIRFPEESHDIFELEDDEGVTHTIPFHRVKEVYKDGELIWHRTR